MLAQKVVHLDEVRAQRAKAEHVRQLCQTVSDRRTIEALTAYADELDQRAAELEATIDRTRQLTGDIAAEIAKANETIVHINDTLSEKSPDRHVS